MQKHVIIVAGGSGARMKQSTPKQFITILEKPVVVHTIEAFLLYDPQVHIVLVLPEAHMHTWMEVKKTYFPEYQIDIALGGKTRFQSVKSGLELVSDGLVAIHDAVRPLVSTKVIGEAFVSAEKYGSGVVMVPLKDSIRELERSSSVAKDRSKYLLVQTPQTFESHRIKDAFKQQESPQFTDDASVYEAAGNTVKVTEGDYRNIKITTPEDLKIAEVLLAQSEK